MLINQKNEQEITHLSESYSWLKPLIEQISTRFENPAGTKNGFPCVFSHKAFSLKNIKFLPIPFLEKWDRHDFSLLANGLEDFLVSSKEWDGNISTAEPLLVIFQPTSRISSTKDFENIFIRSLQYLIDNDKLEWDTKLSSNPEQEFWTMCFAGVQIFINVSHPNHQNRKSRNLCEALVFVINPRERFDKVAGNNPQGHLIRETIRNNIDIYDLIPRSKYLGHYQYGDSEWSQYMLPDNNESPPLKCPLTFKIKD